ncbi:glycosyltransferase family 39 protein [Sphingomicrobium sp. XHP0235]|uniref:glycosyltransferase family 39 protein n=1 Tax=Sphingomicrobium aquimarinum TaxID=3133971 RepID=UPI0031FF33C4
MSGEGGVTTSRTWAVLGAILLGGLFVRAVAIGAQPLWGDESLSLVVARYSLNELFFEPVDPTPGLYYAVQNLWLPAGDAGWVVRMPALVFGTATIGAAFWLGRAAHSTAAGLWCAALVAVMPPLVDYAQEARAYALLVLLGTLMLAAVASALSGDTVRRGRLVLAILFAVLAIYTHVTAWLLVGTVGLAALSMVMRRDAVPLWQVLAALVVAALLVLPEALRVLAYARISQFNWLGQESIGGVIAILAGLVLPVPVEDGRSGGNLIFTILATSVLALAAWLVVQRRLAEKHGSAEWPPVALILCLVVTLGFPLALFGAGLVTPMLMPRTLLPFTIGIALAGAIMIVRSGSTALGVAGLVLIGSQLALFSTAREKPDWRGVATAVEAEGEGPVIVCADWNLPAFVSAYRTRDAERDMMLTVGRRIVAVGTAEGALERFRTRVWEPRTLRERGLDREFVVDPAMLDDAVIVSAGCEAPIARWLDEQLPVAARKTVATFAAGSDFPEMQVERFRR